MAIGVTFPENEDVVAFGRKNEMLVLLVSKLGIYQKELGNYAGYWLRKVYWKDLHYRGMQISRNALTHVQHNISFQKIKGFMCPFHQVQNNMWYNTLMTDRWGGEDGQRITSALSVDIDLNIQKIKWYDFWKIIRKMHEKLRWFLFLPWKRLEAKQNSPKSVDRMQLSLRDFVGSLFNSL